MNATGVSIHYLGHHPGLAEQLAQWSWDEWRPIYERRGQTFADALRNYRERIHVECVPLALVALTKGGELIGTASIKHSDLDVRPQIKVWLGGVYVRPDWRRRGVASMLMRRAVDEAKRLQLPDLHLWTASAESLYLKLGWRVVERLEYHGKDIVIMSHSLD